MVKVGASQGGWPKGGRDVGRWEEWLELLEPFNGASHEAPQAGHGVMACQLMWIGWGLDGRGRCASVLLRGIGWVCDSATLRRLIREFRSTATRGGLTSCSRTRSKIDLLYCTVLYDVLLSYFSQALEESWASARVPK